MDSWSGICFCANVRAEGFIIYFDGPMVQLIVRLVVWMVVEDFRGAPNNPFHKGIPGIQTTNPNHQLKHY